VTLLVKHVATDELAAIPSAAEDLFIIGGKDAFEKRQREEQQQRDKVSFCSCVVALGWRC
jgi:hypothetical protein